MISGVDSRLGSVYSKITAGFGKIGGSGREEAGRSSGFASAVRSRTVDLVTISGGRPMSDTDFISSLSMKLSSEVRAGAAERDIFDIKQQIAFGEYDINAGDIASRIVS